MTTIDAFLAFLGSAVLAVYTDSMETDVRDQLSLNALERTNEETEG